MDYKLTVILIIYLSFLTVQLNCMINKGCKAYDCHRNCVSQDVSKTPGDNGFKFEIDGSHTNKYVPGKTYTSKFAFAF